MSDDKSRAERSPGRYRAETSGLNVGRDHRGRDQTSGGGVNAGTGSRASSPGQNAGRNQRRGGGPEGRSFAKREVSCWAGSEGGRSDQVLGVANFVGGAILKTQAE